MGVRDGTTGYWTERNREEPVKFICDPCKEAADSSNEFLRSLGHANCTGKGRCDCQHTVRGRLANG